MNFGPYPGIVDRVVDGDTVYIKLDLGFGITWYARTRVYGMNAPELSTEQGKTSKVFAELLLPNESPCTVISKGWDKYGGRIDGIITLPDGRDFAREMVNAGMAVPYTM